MSFAKNKIESCSHASRLLFVFGFETQCCNQMFTALHTL